MPTQEVEATAHLSSALRSESTRPHAVLFDGAGATSWGDGTAWFSDTPRSTIEVFASGWGRWCSTAGEYWSRGDPLQQWQRFLDACRTIGRSLPAPDATRIVSLLSYDLGARMERSPRRHRPRPEPLIFGAFYDWNETLDYRTRRAVVTTQSARQLATHLRPNQHWRRSVTGQHVLNASRPRPDMSRSQYRHMIRQALDYITAGDVYQVNLAQRFRMPFSREGAPALFSGLNERYPMPFSAYIDGGPWLVVSNSPECFVEVDHEYISTMPIKGTRWEQPALGSVGTPSIPPLPLRKDAKEMAEHVMIVDLERNDLGRICEAGSVHVTEFARLRNYPLVDHMESRIEGRLLPGTSLTSVLAATFPGGSITGAPKIRSMEVIDELEPCPRGFYTGVLGWTDVHGRSRFNIAIRSATIAGGELLYHAGGGIVADSDPDREYEETLAKSEAFFRILAGVQHER